MRALEEGLRSRQALLLWFLAIASVLWASRPAHAQSIVFGAGFRAFDADGPVHTSPLGVAIGAAAHQGSGVEVRWAADSTYRWLTVDFMQIAPGPRRARLFQPFGVAGLTVVDGLGERRVGFNFAGGGLLFVSSHVGVYVDYRYFRGPGTIGGVEFLSRTFSLGIVGRL